MTTPRVSILIPAYNADKYINQTLNSIWQQTDQNFEVIIVNDGSIDGTLNTLNLITKPSLRIYTQKNSGVSVARNTAIKHAKGEYLYFLDADDLLAIDAIERAFTAAKENPDAVLIYGDSITFQSSSTPKTDEKCNSKILAKRPQGNVISHILTTNFIACGGVLIKKSALNQTSLFPEGIKLGEDWALWVELATVGKFVYLSGHAMCFYRQHENSASRELALEFSETLPSIHHVFSLASIKSLYSENELKKLKRHSIAASYAYCAQESLKSKIWTKARFNYLRSIKHRPFHMRTWILLLCALIQFVPNIIMKKLK